MAGFPSAGWSFHTAQAAELTRASFTRQAQYGRRVIFAWRPADAAATNPLTTPWPLVEELIEGIAFADDIAARRFDLTQVAGGSAWVANRDVADPGRTWNSSTGRSLMLVRVFTDDWLRSLLAHWMMWLLCRFCRHMSGATRCCGPRPRCSHEVWMWTR
jgi:hypothetical protein